MMKVKNVVFSGFMAAIMMGAGAASAATQIASKTYVDNKVDVKASKVTGGVANNIATITADGSYADGGVAAADLVTTTNLGDQVTNVLQNSETIQNAVTNIIENSDVVSTAVAGKADLLENVGVNAGNIATVDAAGQYQVSTTNIDDLATNTSVTNSITTAITNALADGGTIDAKLDEKVDVAQGTANAIMVTDASGNVTTATTIAASKVTGLTDLATIAPAECSNETSLCVLAFNGTSYSWVNVTNPVDGGTSTGDAGTGE